MTEKWKSLKGLIECGDFYEVSNLGRVRSIDRKVLTKGGSYRTAKGKILKLKEETNGYLRVQLSCEDKQKQYSVHRLVALAFIPNPYNLPQVNHKNEFAKTNNCVDNLEWCDAKYNQNYGTCSIRSGEKHRKKILCYKYPTMEFVGEFDSIAIASELLKISRKDISIFLNSKGRKQTKGYYFEFVEGDNNA